MGQIADKKKRDPPKPKKLIVMPAPLQYNLLWICQKKIVIGVMEQNELKFLVESLNR